MFGMYEFVRQQLLASPYWEAMVKTVENSPYHREENVAVHTNMVTTNYIKLTNKPKESWTNEDMLGAVACLFHDVGKPMAEVETKEKFLWFTIKTKRSYQNHEAYSANLFVDFCNEYLPEGFFTDEEIYIIHTMIVLHRPFVSKGKLLGYIKHFKYMNVCDQFIRMVEADTTGRTYDPEKLVLADQNLTEWKEMAIGLANATGTDFVPNENIGVLLPVAISGSGKSTFTAQQVGVLVTSLDEQRMRFYDGDTIGYEAAFRKAEDDKEFGTKTVQEFHELLKDGRIVVVDNTNTGKRYRRRYTEAAKQRKIGTEAVLFMIPRKVAMSRAAKRKDKHIPYRSIETQWYNRTFPLMGEVDKITFYRG